MATQTLESIKEKLAKMSDSPSVWTPIQASSGSGGRMTSWIDLDANNIKYRYEFIRLGEEERQLFVELIPWAQENAAKIAKEFYDWQFSFSRTLNFFKQMAAEKGISLDALRSHLEQAQTGYFIACFTGAREGWALDYLESRLNIGAVHDRINLPFKWYVGAYIEFLSLSKKYLKESFEDAEYADRIHDILIRVFNLDTQAVGDAFIMSTIAALGFDLDTISTTAETDRTEHLEQIKAELEAQKIQNADYQGQLEAISKAQAVIEFDMDGTIRTANHNFLSVMGYKLDEIRGQHHSIFAEASLANSRDYSDFWAALNRGEYQSGQYKRVGKGGQEVWIQASYNPIIGPDGKPFKVVKYATDITQSVIESADFKGQLEAIGKAQAVIEFEMDGTIRTANQNFLSALGYTLNEIKGKHHSMFAEPELASSREYADFWAALGRGEYQAGQYKRLGKGGKEVWIQASYNPIIGPNGEPFKVVKYASDVTEEVVGKLRLQKSVETILQAVEAAKSGDLTHDISVSGEDAIGKMANGMKGFFENLRSIIAQIDENAQMLAAASEQLSAVSDQMGENASETSSQANVVASSAEEVNSNVQTVAAGAEELSASIQQVANNTGEAARVANEAVETAQTTNKTVAKLGESSIEIGNVIKVITSIAQQTNLLALNATIEAARAGEAGKGFAVVANEVKELAKQTAQATEDISQKIEAIQADTQGAVQAIDQIGDIIGRIDEIQGEIAGAVEEQSTTTSEIARNVNEAAKGSAEIAENIAQVAIAAESTASGASDSKNATMELARMASTLRSIVSKFKY